MEHGADITNGISDAVGATRTYIEGLARGLDVPARQFVIAVAGVLLSSEGVRSMGGKHKMSPLRGHASQGTELLRAMEMVSHAHSDSQQPHEIPDPDREKRHYHHGKKKKKREGGITAAGRKRLSFLMKKRWRERKKAARAA